MANALNQLKAMNKKDNYAIGSVSNSGGGGSGGGVVFVDCTESGATVTATKTAGEIFNLIMDGNAVVFRRQNGDLVILMPCLHANNISKYTFYVFVNNGDVAKFTADTASDYPILGNK